MMNTDPLIRQVMERVPAWLPQHPGKGDIVISSRIRLARNLHGFPFPLNASPTVRGEVANAFFDAMEATENGDWLRLAMEPLNDLSVALLFERKLISREFLTREPGRFLVLASDPRLSVMINEEDHFRMQYCRSDGNLMASWTELSEFESRLQKILNFSYLPERGYITSCPSNLGTGIRASVMMHLPALRILDRLKTLKTAFANMGMTARGLNGEGTDIIGNLYQISNQSTLGESEEDIIRRLLAVVADIEQEERNAREELLSGDNLIRLSDCCARAYGNLKYCYQIASSEALNLLSLLRLGCDCGFFPDIPVKELNRMLLLSLPAHLAYRAGRELSPEERAAGRAALFREFLSNPAPGEGNGTVRE
ncbi:MAG: ATP--guanido phosphotransferase [Lentisphaeria bacterium]|nr:ATP--guanido phosphotransferase [Lentisphaeria bacterium]